MHRRRGTYYATHNVRKPCCVNCPKNPYVGTLTGIDKMENKISFSHISFKTRESPKKGIKLKKKG